MKNIFLVALVISVMVLSITTQQNTAEDKVVFLDVGQGDAILLQEGVNQVLVDGGPGALVVQRLEEEMPKFDREVEVLVMSHPQQDHFEGFLHVIDQYEVGLVVMPYVATESELYQAFLGLLEEKHIPYRFAWAGQSLSFDALQISVLGPHDTDLVRTISRADINNASTVLRVDFHDMSFLLTGDAERIAEHVLVQNTLPELLDVDVLKAGHHGSNSSTYGELLNAASPGGVVISVGEGNRFGHPRKETLERLAGIPIWRTDTDGSVRFTWRGGSWLVGGGVH